MPIRFRCTHCRQMLSISRRRAGSSVRCPACDGELIVPGLDELSAEGESTMTDRRDEPGGSLAEVASPDVEQTARITGAGPEGSVGGADSGARSALHQPPDGSADASPTVDGDANVPPSRRTAAKHTDADDEGGLVLRAPQTEFEEMDLTPMVDVTFLLLIFFMITASFTLQKSLDVPRPDPEEQGATQSLQMQDLLDDSVKVEIDANNAIYVDDDKLSDPSTLIDTLRDKMGFSSQYGRRNELLLIPDPRALHETVVTVIDAAQEVGMQRIRLAGRSQ